MLRGENIVFTENVEYEPSSVSILPGGNEVAVGGAQVSKLRSERQGFLNRYKSYRQIVFNPAFVKRKLGLCNRLVSVRR